MDLVQKKVSRMVTVIDDWYPCFPGNQVRVTLGMYFFRGYYVKLSVWGMDDKGVEMEYPANSAEDAERKFAEWESIYLSIPDGADTKWFLSNGFGWA